MPRCLKYFLFVLILLVFSLETVTAAGWRYVNQPNIRVYYTAAKVKFNTYPVTIKDVVYVSIRDIAESMSLELSYNNRQNYYEIKRAGDFRSVIFKLHSKKIKVNGKDETLMYPVRLIKNQYYVPLNDFLWTLGYFVKIDGNQYHILSKIKEIAWQDQALVIKGQAPLNCVIEYVDNSYLITVYNTILGMHAEDIEVEDGCVCKVSYRQESLNPARVKVIVKVVKRVLYTALKEDSDNAYLVRFKYAALKRTIPTAKKVIVKDVALSEVKAPKAKAGVSLTTGVRLFSSNTALWFSETLLSSRQSIDFVINGKLYQNILIKKQDAKTYVLFDDVFSVLGCKLVGNSIRDSQGNSYKIANQKLSGPGVAENYRLVYVQGKTYVPLQQTLRITGFAAYLSSERIYINPRIAELEYTKNKNHAILAIKANAKINPREITYLKNPYRCIIDIPNSAYDAPINNLRPQDKYCEVARGAQFDKGVARVVLELKSRNIKPRFLYGDNENTLLVVLAPKEIGLSEVPIKTKTTPMSVANALSQTKNVIVKDVPPVIPKEKFTITKVGTPKKSLRGVKVAIIAGHGGVDVGAISRSGYMEKIPTLEVSRKLAKILKEKGAIPLLCREDDRNISLEKQAEFAMKNKADILISIHFNSFIGPSISGAETFYYKDIDYRLAKAVHTEIVRTTAVKNKGLKKAMMHNLNHTTMPGVLVEPAFLSNRREELMIKSQVYQWKLAKAISRGIENYLKKNN